MGTWNTLFDVINVALNVSQSAKLDAMRKQVTTEGEQQMLDVLRRQYIEAMRYEVFSAGKQLQILAEYKEEAPQAVLVALRAIQWKLDALGITERAFTETQDMEYVHNVRGHLQDAMGDASSRLNDDQRLEAAKCVEVISRMPLLNQAIELQAAAEAWQQTEPEWKQLESKRKSQQLVGWLIGLGSLPLTVVVAVVAYSIAYSGHMSNVGALVCLTPGIPIVGIVVGIAINAQGKTKAWSELRQKRTQLEQKLQQREDLALIYKTFGQKTSAQYAAMRTEGEAFVRRMLAPTERFNLPAALLDS